MLKYYFCWTIKKYGKKNIKDCTLSYYKYFRGRGNALHKRDDF